MNIRLLARKLDLSKSTVSLALKNHPSVAIATRERVQRLAKKEKYTPNPKVSLVMSAISRRAAHRVTAPLALLSTWHERRVWRNPHYNLDRFHAGCVRRAAELGYQIEEFWLNSPGMTARRMEQILATRGIEGVLVFNYLSAPAVLELDLAKYASVVIGRALVQPRIFAVDCDHHQALFVAHEAMRRRGYQRIGFVPTADAHERTMHCWAAAYQFITGYEHRTAQLPIFIDQGADPAPLRAWYDAHRPDAVIVGDSRALQRFREIGVEIPRNIGLATLFWRTAAQGCAGVDARDEDVAGRSVELLVEQLKNFRHGLPSVPETVLIDGLWRDGATLPDRGTGLV